jgi:glycosyltransferase involved in cell wall biosynthesis
VKIACVIPGGVDRSGEFRVIPALLALISRLAKRNEVHVFALHQEPQPACWDLVGARIHNIGHGHTAARAILAICAEHRVARFDVIQAIWSGKPGFVAVCAASLLQLPCMVHLAGGELAALPDIGYGGRRNWRGRWREALVLRRATVVTAASAAMLDAVAELGIEAQRLPLGADLTVWQPHAPVRRDLRVPVRLVHVASLNRVKDQTTLLLALAALRDQKIRFHVDIIGEDTLGHAVQQRAAELNLGGAVRFHGFLTQREVVPLVRGAHLMMLTSRHEAGPLAVLEAAAVGVPSVGTAVGHLAEWAPNAALCVPVGDWAALARETARLLNDEDRRLRVADCAHQRALLEDADFTVANFQALYDRHAGRANAKA